MPLKRSIWLQYAKFWKINEAANSLATTVGVRQQGNKRKRLPVKERKAKPARANYTNDDRLNEGQNM